MTIEIEEQQSIEAEMLKILAEGKPVRIFDSVKHIVSDDNMKYFFTGSKLPDNTDTERRFHRVELETDNER